MKSKNEQMMVDLSQEIIQAVDPGAVAILLAFGGDISILQFERHELDAAVAAFSTYFDMFRMTGNWRDCFESAFTDPLPKRHVATILITSSTVENGVVFPLSEAN